MLTTQQVDSDGHNKTYNAKSKVVIKLHEACTACQKTFMYYRFQPRSTISKSVKDGLQQGFKENFSPKNRSRSNPD